MVSTPNLIMGRMLKGSSISFPSEENRYSRLYTFELGLVRGRT